MVLRHPAPGAIGSMAVPNNNIKKGAGYTPIIICRPNRQQMMIDAK